MFSDVSLEWNVRQQRMLTTIPFLTRERYKSLASNYRTAASRWRFFFFFFSHLSYTVCVCVEGI